MPDPQEVNLVAKQIVERHRERAIDFAVEMEAVSSRPEFARAVRIEVERLLKGTLQ